MNLRSKIFNSGLTATILIIFNFNLFCQNYELNAGPESLAVLILKFPEVRSGTVEILHKITLDSTINIHTDTFNSKDIIINLTLEEALLRNDPLLVFALSFSDGSFKSATFPGQIDTVMYDIVSNKIIYPDNNKFFLLTQLTNDYKGDSSQYNLIVPELAGLYKNYPLSEYTSFIIYNATTNKALARKDLTKYFDIQKNETYWIQRLREYLPVSEASLANFEDTLNHYISIHEMILIKFWGSWCKPCLADNEKLEKLVKENSFKPFILGIQNDKKASEKLPFYSNILDDTRTITSHYEVSVFPTYILLKNGALLLRTTSLQEIITYLQ